jgi:hypothetical protein
VFKPQDFKKIILTEVLEKKNKGKKPWRLEETGLLLKLVNKYKEDWA